jgi:hypothetical protein
MPLRQGSKAAEEEAQKSQFQSDRADFFRLTDGETATFRVLDHPTTWISTNQHSFVPTRGPAPDADDKVKAKWPKEMGAVCRKDSELRADFPDGCYICDRMTNPKNKSGRYTAPIRVWARLIKRLPVEGTEAMVEKGLIKAHQVGRTVGFMDEMVESDELDKDGERTGKKIKHPKIVVANFSMDNFFGPLDGYEDAYADEGGLATRDITVTRVGAGTETNYKLAPRTATPDFDLADPETKAAYEGYAALCHLSWDDLVELIMQQASDEHYARFFDVTKPFPKFKKDSDDASGAPAEQQQKPVEDPATQDQLASMAARVRAGNKNPAASGDADEPQTSVNFSNV